MIKYSKAYTQLTSMYEQGPQGKQLKTALN